MEGTVTGEYPAKEVAPPPQNGLCVSLLQVAVFPHSAAHTCSACGAHQVENSNTLSMAIEVHTQPEICRWWLAPDHTYIGVLRTAPGCTMWRNRFACDGFCKQPGGPGGGDVVERVYGCWFYTAFLAANSSDAVVDVGRSLRVVHRCDVNRLLGLPVQRTDGFCSNSDR